ncbi:MAG: restriction endonuclease [Bacteroidales bacterium]|nr:restriction endonuclease [Bacteroidales bacterium]
MKELKEAADNKRQWNFNFIKYTEFIVAHPNYKGLFYERGNDGKIKWVVTGKSDKGQERRKWWDEQCKKYGIKIEAGAYAKIAAKIHPTKKHTCQICGKELSVEYIYPNKRTVTAFLKEFGVRIVPFSKDIFQIMNELVKSENDIEKVKRIFRIRTSEKITMQNLNEYLQKYFVDCYAKGLLSPGVMSNSPDRFDGFHSDGACCRHESDKGRHKSNLQRYGQDRRVYENWADGDWKMADRLMSLFRKQNLSADHIGPISLAFCHRPKFHPLTKAENSAKNNRMSLSDVKLLLTDEKTEQVVSWHSKFIWDKLKNKVSNVIEAVKLSDLMRKNLHHVLIIFSMIEEKGFGEFLEQFLNPEYSFFDYKFEGFDPTTGTYKSVQQIKKTGKNQQNNIKRYYRISFDVLKEYKEKENRKNKIWNHKEVDTALEKMFELLKSRKNEDAKNQLEFVFQKLADLAESNW